MELKVPEIGHVVRSVAYAVIYDVVYVGVLLLLLLLLAPLGLAAWSVNGVLSLVLWLIVALLFVFVVLPVVAVLRTTKEYFLLRVLSGRVVNKDEFVMLIRRGVQAFLASCVVGSVLLLPILFVLLVVLVLLLLKVNVWLVVVLGLLLGVVALLLSLIVSFFTQYVEWFAYEGEGWWTSVMKSVHLVLNNVLYVILYDVVFGAVIIVLTLIVNVITRVLSFVLFFVPAALSLSLLLPITLLLFIIVMDVLGNMLLVVKVFLGYTLFKNVGKA